MEIPAQHAAPLLAKGDAAEGKHASSQRKLKVAACLALTFMAIEIAGGILAHSLAILTDAAHMLSDVAGFLVSLIALSITSRPPDEVFSFGYHRAEVRAGLARRPARTVRLTAQFARARALAPPGARRAALHLRRLVHDGHPRL